MPERILRKYGEQAVIDFILFKLDGINFRTDASAAIGDTKISMDEGIEVDTTNTFVDNGTGYSLTLEATETAAKRLFISIVDQDATKTWLDDYIMIETYGDTNAMHSFNLDADLSTNSETWKFKNIDIHHDSGEALSIISDTSSAVNLVAGGDGNALDATGAGSGSALDFRGGATGNGITIAGGSTSGDGVDISTTNGHGIDITPVANSTYAINATAMGGSNSGCLRVTTLGTGINITAMEYAMALGGGMYVSGGVNKSALKLNGNGTGHGFEIVGGTTGNAVEITGGSTSGKGINITTMDGHGINVDATSGSDNIGIYIEGKTIGIQAQGETNGIWARSYAVIPLSGTGFKASGSGGPGVEAIGDGAFAGLKIVGGATGHGAEIIGGSTSGDGMHVLATDGHGMFSQAGGNKDGLFLWGAGTESGLRAVAGVVGTGISVTGSPSNPAVNIIGGPDQLGLYVMGTGGAVKFEANLFDGVGLELVGRGTEAGFKVSGGETGSGIEVNGGSTNGEGVNISATDGHGIKVAAGGLTNRHGVYIIGSDTGSGITAIGGGGNGSAGITSGGSGYSMGMHLASGGNSQPGLLVDIPGSNTIGDAIKIIGGTDSGNGITVSTINGEGIDISGGSLGGDGIKVSTTDGAALNLSASNGEGINVGSSGVGNTAMKIRSFGGHGIEIESGTGVGPYDGIHIRSNIGAGINIASISGHAVSAVCTGGGYSGIFAQGQNTAPGIKTEGGIAGNGLDIHGGIAAGHGINVETNEGMGIRILVQGTGGSYHGIYSQSQGGSGLYLLSSDAAALHTQVGNGEYPGIYVKGLGSGHGIEVLGGNTGNGLYVKGGVDNKEGILIEGQHTGAGLKILGGSNGTGLYIEGGSTGHGIQIIGGSSSGDGIYVKAQGGNSNGVSFHKSGSGKDIDADELTGLLTLSTTVDGITLEDIYELELARMNGKFEVTSFGLTDRIKFYKRDNVTLVTEIEVSPTERTRIS